MKIFRDKIYLLITGNPINGNIEFIQDCHGLPRVYGDLTAAQKFAKNISQVLQIQVIVMEFQVSNNKAMYIKGEKE